MYDSNSNLNAVDNVDAVATRFSKGEIDLVAVGRAAIGDPAWARKSLAGEATQPFDPTSLAQLS
jgi:2,4-dienoyl-CoA reductase-like NADH-dependent reductase (Old Yellow Enzyme family)